MIWHFRFGQAVLALLMFRLLWGLVGGHWSRFSNFIVHPLAVLSELRGRGRPEWHTGHSALGSLAVIAFVLVLLAQVGSGLVSDDAIAFAGPLTHLVSSAIVSQASAYHKEVGKLLLIGLVLLHVLAIIWHTFKGRALVGAMVHGDKPLEQVMPASRDGWRQRLLAAILMVLCVAASAWVFSLAPTF
jgi:cytochrome b